MREQEDRQERIRELQLVQLELIKLFVDICEKEHLTYYMLGGTMLGAIRHKGYIPWDDDADFGMPRPDYEKFLLVSEQYLPQFAILTTFENTTGYLYYYVRLTSIKKRIRVCSTAAERIENTGIDIMPLDGMPNGFIGNYLYQFKLLALRAMFRFSVFDEGVDISGHHRVWYKRVLIFMGRHFHAQKLFSTTKRWRKLDTAMKKYNCKVSNYFANIMGAYQFKEMFRKEVFGEGAFYEFEGMQLRGPKDYDFYLTQLYGDYMTPPPESERNWHSTEIVEGNGQ